MAKLAGVDVAVVSRILSGDRKLSVRQQTRERVLTAVAQLDYRPNSAARSLRTARAGAFGLIIPDFHNTVYSTIIEGAQDAALSLGCALLTASFNSRSAAAEKLADILANGTIDGLLIAGTVDPEELSRLFATQRRPVLSVNRRLPGMNRYVILDDAAASRRGVEHLVSLGHRRIAHLAGPRNSDTAERRLDGFLEAVEEAAITVPMSHIAHSDYTVAGGHRAMRDLLRVEPRPTAVLVANVASALGALSAVRDEGLTVPDDLSLVSIHDSDLAEYSSPGLTAVRMPLYELGFRGVNLLATTEPDAHVQEVVDSPVELVVRGSTAPLPGGG